jgi:ribonuclease T1
LPAGVPAKVATVLHHIDTTHKAPPGYEGGRPFHNAEKRLPQKDKDGHAITYQEWDVNAKVQGVNRGAERLITGSDGSAYYTSDHYRTFIKLR